MFVPIKYMTCNPTKPVSYCVNFSPGSVHFGIKRPWFRLPCWICKGSECRLQYCRSFGCSGSWRGQSLTSGNGDGKLETRSFWLLYHYIGVDNYKQMASALGHANKWKQQWKLYAGLRTHYCKYVCSSQIVVLYWSRICIIWMYLCLV